MKRTTCTMGIVMLLWGSFPLFAQEINMGRLLEDENIEAINRTIRLEEEAVMMDAQPSDGLGILKGISFEEGSIELDIKGANKPGQSFVGLAFNIENDSTYEAVYFRPFNFVAEEPIRRAHMVQYIYHPAFPWYRLREERTGEFEHEIQPAPSPDDWFHVKLEITEKKVSVFVEGATSPVLEVARLSKPKTDVLAIWTGFNSEGQFRNLKLKKK